MTGSQYKSISAEAVTIRSGHFFNTFVCYYQVGNFFFEEEDAACSKYLLSHSGNDLWKLIGAYMRMCFIKNTFIGAELGEEVKDPADVAALVASRV